MFVFIGIKQIFISGDNDIGGEYFGDRNDYLAERFERYFGPMVDFFSLNSFIDVVKLDLDYTVSFYNRVKRSYLLNLQSEYEASKLDGKLARDDGNNDDDENEEHRKSMNDKFTVVLNHMSLLRKNPQELNAVSVNDFLRFNFV